MSGLLPDLTSQLVRENLLSFQEQQANGQEGERADSRVASAVAAACGAVDDFFHAGEPRAARGTRVIIGCGFGVKRHIRTGGDIDVVSFQRVPGGAGGLGSDGPAYDVYVVTRANALAAVSLACRIDRPAVNYNVAS